MKVFSISLTLIVLSLFLLTSTTTTTICFAQTILSENNDHLNDQTIDSFDFHSNESESEPKPELQIQQQHEHEHEHEHYRGCNDGVTCTIESSINNDKEFCFTGTTKRPDIPQGFLFVQCKSLFDSKDSNMLCQNADSLFAWAVCLLIVMSVFHLIQKRLKYLLCNHFPNEPKTHKRCKRIALLSCMLIVLGLLISYKIYDGLSILFLVHMGKLFSKLFAYIIHWIYLEYRLRF